MKYFKPINVCIALIFVIACLITVYFFDAHQRKNNNAPKPHMEVLPIEPKKGSKDTYAMPPEAVEQLMEMTMDPILKRGQPENLIDVRNQIKKGQYLIKKSSEIEEWVERGPNNVGGRSRSILIDANDKSGSTVWAGSVSGGLWKSTNFTREDATWKPINDFFQNIAVSTILQDPINPQIMYFGTGEGWFNGDAVAGLGIWKSTDGGANWDQLTSTNNSNFSHIQKLVIDQNGKLFAGSRSWEVESAVLLV